MERLNLSNFESLVEYGALTLLETSCRDGEPYISVMVDSDDLNDYYLVTKITNENLSRYKKGDICLYSLIKSGNQWYKCDNNNYILIEYSDFSKIPGDYLPEYGYFNK